MRRVLNIVRLLAPLLVVTLAGLQAAETGLYEVTTIVTGQGEANRAGGFAAAVQAVLVKVSGDPLLADDPRVRAEAGRAGAFVQGFSYRDRLAGLPTRDEQGTRDRPYDLTVRFRPDRIDALLRSLEREPWPTPRPRIVAFVQVEGGAAPFVLASDGDSGQDQREALNAAADGLGLPLILPSEAELGASGLDLDALGTADAAGLDAAARAAGGDLALVGELAWSEADLVWSASWRLALDGKTLGWRAETASFDEAFRAAMRGAAGILSGHGER